MPPAVEHYGATSSRTYRQDHSSSGRDPIALDQTFSSKGRVLARADVSTDCRPRKQIRLTFIFVSVAVIFFGAALLFQRKSILHSFFRSGYTTSGMVTPPTILISLDGFRHEYLFRKRRRVDGEPTLLAPNLRTIASNGAFAVEGMEPIMPTKTKPNHWALATGLFAESGGIIENQMYDPLRRVWFTDTRDGAHWYSGLPIWRTIRNTRRLVLDADGKYARSDENYVTACIGWPGSEVQEHAANFVWKFNESAPYEDRVMMAIGMLNGSHPNAPAAAQFVTVYLKATDVAGHRYGPNSYQVDEAIERVDKTVGFLLSNLGERVSELHNIVIVSDHGMAEMSRESVIDLTPIIEEGTVQDITRSPMGLFLNISVSAEQLYRNIDEGMKGQATVYRKESLPERWHLKHNSLVTPVVTVADLGWTVQYPHQSLIPGPHDWQEKQKSSSLNWLRGDHGFDNKLPDMQAIFLAQGPSFKARSVVRNMRAVDLYEMLCHIFSATPSPNNGSLETTKPILSSFS